jgi:signal transduction histidine kinase
VAQVDMFDARQLKRWKLDEARLPPGSVVRFREPSAWELYRGYIVAAIVVLVTQAALIGGLLVARTRQRRAEAEMLRQRDDLAHVLRVTTLSELTSELAHEISQPLTSILLNAKAAIRFLAGGRPGDAKEIEGALTDIVAGAGHASSVLERLRALFRKERVEKGPVDVRTLVDHVMRLLHGAMLVERIDIRLVFGENLSPVFGDPVQLEQVLLNVVRNACDAIGARRDGPRVITIQASKVRSDQVVIEVADTGIGVKTQDLEHIFEHFVSTKPNGLGMGLAISRSIINAHGGLIWASANPDGGLTVHIELVAWLSDTETAVAALRKSAAPAG